MRHRTGTPLVLALATVSLALVAAPAEAAPANVTPQQCADGGGVEQGGDPFPPAWCVGGKYDGQMIDLPGWRAG